MSDNTLLQDAVVYGFILAYFVALFVPALLKHHKNRKQRQLDAA